MRQSRQEDIKIRRNNKERGRATEIKGEIRRENNKTKEIKWEIRRVKYKKKEIKGEIRRVKYKKTETYRTEGRVRVGVWGGEERKERDI